MRGEVLVEGLPREVQLSEGERLHIFMVRILEASASGPVVFSNDRPQQSLLELLRVVLKGKGVLTLVRVKQTIVIDAASVLFNLAIVKLIFVFLRVFSIVLLCFFNS